MGRRWPRPTNHNHRNPLETQPALLGFSDQNTKSRREAAKQFCGLHLYSNAIYASSSRWVHLTCTKTSDPAPSRRRQSKWTSFAADKLPEDSLTGRCLPSSLHSFPIKRRLPVRDYMLSARGSNRRRVETLTPSNTGDRLKRDGRPVLARTDLPTDSSMSLT
ncbi:hypothetical protein N657DRAFT_410221 [Parathielavia appendiculata]|uniref:Uncharacterized protein n=1 Tax=Parathielavia appendiculata TaxID=2587402 RepID=A0AAN6Z2R8_9PEZI|nr:hypothetical protein N657DRAFT_410221 [Parathielavia appendiculata]